MEDNKEKLLRLFEELRELDVIVKVESSCCHSLQNVEDDDRCICARAMDMDDIMEELDFEGMAMVTWDFSGDIGPLLLSVFSKYGYIVEWKPNMPKKIMAVVAREELPKAFLDDWYSIHEINLDDEDVRVDPDEDVVFTEEEKNQKIYDSEEDEEEEEEEEEEEGPIVDVSDEDVESLCDF